MLKMFLSAVATGNDTSSADPGGGVGGSNPSPFNFHKIERNTRQKQVMSYCKF